jgi:Helix-turn-helix domain
MPFKPLPKQQLHTNLLPQYLTSTEACLLLRVSHRTLIRYYQGYITASGRRERACIPVVHRYGRKLFPKADLLKFLEELTVRV